MKNLRFRSTFLHPALLACLAAGLLLAGCAGIRIIDTASVATIDITGDPEGLPQLEQLSQGRPIEQPVILKIPQGTAVPVQVSVETPLARMEGGCGDLHFDKDLYLYLSAAEILVSPDGNRWAGMDDRKAVNTLFGIQGGQFRVGLSASKIDGTALQIKVLASPRK
jgi:hypothetical protein